jgi:site-specific DNA-methyltransferase (adenine-specific)
VDRPKSPFFAWPSTGSPRVVLWEEDALTGLARHLPPASVDVVVTSPPYNRGMKYGVYHDRRPRASYLRWMGDLAGALGPLMSEEGSFFLNIGGAPKDPWLPWDVAREVGSHFVLQNVIHWVKSIAIDHATVGQATGLDRDLAVGHYKPLRSARYLHGAQEYIFHFTKNGEVPLDRLAIGVPYQDTSNVDRWRGGAQGVRCRGNTWFLPYPTIRSRAEQRPHPASFPPELAERCLRLHGRARIRQSVDPFVGIGSSALAALAVDVPFTGFDIDAGYLAIAAQRVREAVGEGPADPRTSKGRARSTEPPPSPRG